jgi:hypothetical protein
MALPAPACRAVDTSAKVLSDTLLSEIARLGYQGIGRTVPVLGYPADSEITPGELDRILSHPAGFGSWWYQRPRNPGWRPREHDAEADALFACRCAKLALYPDGTHGFVDAEGMADDTTHAEAHAYNSAWARIAREEGYSLSGAGLYDGYSEPETPVELYEIHDVNCYWSDMANRRVAVRGTAIVQGPEIRIMGVRFDEDFLAPDKLGGSLRWARIVGADLEPAA